MAKDRSESKPATPKKPGRIAQLREVITRSRQLDPAIGWWMALAFVLALAVVVAIGVWVHYPWYAVIVGLPLAMLAATIVMSRRADAAAYRQIEGKPGAVGAALTALRSGWYTDSQPVAVDGGRGDLTTAAMVYRAVGRAGVVLVAEGPDARAQKLLGAERKKVERVVPGVPVTTLRIGAGEAPDVVAVRKLVSRIQRMRATMTKEEAATANKRLRALGGVRPPLPAGIDPNRVRVDRKAMRGR
jgi:hypothetical protein